MDKYDLKNQQNAPFSKLHIELLKQIEGSSTFTNFIKPMLPKNRTKQPWYNYYYDCCTECECLRIFLLLL